MANLDDLSGTEFEVTDGGYLKVKPKGPEPGCLYLILGFTIMIIIGLFILSKIAGFNWDFFRIILPTSLIFGVILGIKSYFSN